MSYAHFVVWNDRFAFRNDCFAYKLTIIPVCHLLANLLPTCGDVLTFARFALSYAHFVVWNDRFVLSCAHFVVWNDRFAFRSDCFAYKPTIIPACYLLADLLPTCGDVLTFARFALSYTRFVLWNDPFVLSNDRFAYILTITPVCHLLANSVAKVSTRVGLLSENLLLFRRGSDKKPFFAVPFKPEIGGVMEIGHGHYKVGH